MMTALLLLLSSAFAQEPASPAVVVDESVLIEGLPPGPAPSPAEAEVMAQKLGAELRCPVCQGMSVKDSTSSAAVNMYNRIRELCQAGYTESQIKDYFVERYGEWVLLEPTNNGFNWIIWLGPALFLGLGGAFVYATVVQWSKEEDDDLPSDTGAQPKDRYEERLLAELEDE